MSQALLVLLVTKVSRLIPTGLTYDIPDNIIIWDVGKLWCIALFAFGNRCSTAETFNAIAMKGTSALETWFQINWVQRHTLTRMSRCVSWNKHTHTLINFGITWYDRPLDGKRRQEAQSLCKCRHRHQFQQWHNSLIWHLWQKTTNPNLLVWSQLKRYDDGSQSFTHDHHVQAQPRQRRWHHSEDT